MQQFTSDYLAKLTERFDTITSGLEDRLKDIVDGRVTPAIDDIAIGSARKMSASVLFFDIRNFSGRTSSPELADLKKTLYMLDCVIPMVMQVIYDNGGYVEKNTGDGIMGVLGAEEDSENTAKSAVSAALTIAYIIENVINPHLRDEGIDPVDWRMGIDQGQLLIARIGLVSGSAKHPRNFLSLVGTPANIASKIQHEAQTNQILIGNNVQRSLPEDRSKRCSLATPSNWSWIYTATRQTYNVYSYSGRWSDPA